MPGIPTGTVTFIFTDIEGSTNLWEHEPELMRRDFARQEALLRGTFAGSGGYVYKMIGDAFQVAFSAAPQALLAAIEAQRRLSSAEWEGARIRVRMALHTGVTEERGDDYVGPALNRVARLLATGHGGQILLSQVTYELVRDDLPPGVELVDAGEHRLKDLIRPERIYQVTAPGLMDHFPPLKTLDAYPHNLPIQLTSFVGREKEMDEVKHLLLGAANVDGAMGSRTVQSGRLVTLTGPGGTGKTRLSLHVAADLLETFPGGVWFVELASLTDPALVPQTIAVVLGVREGAANAVTASLVDFLRARRVLLILDNCEHLVEACAHIADTLLRGCPGLYILASSRELLNIPGEIPYRVPSLSVPDTHRLPPIDALPQYEAVRLFIERASTIAPGFTVTNANAPALAEICHRLDGIPLAIELVAARVSVLSVEQIAERLGHSFRLLTGGSRTALPRHQTLRALIDWSYDMLPPAEKTLLQRLSVFMGGWTLETAEAVCPGTDAGPDPIYPEDIMDLLAQLVNKSLVQADHGEPARYHLLETIRQYGMEKLQAAGQDSVIRRRHLAYFAGLAGQPESELRGPNQAAWLERFGREIDNLRAALEWAMIDDIEAGLTMAAALQWFWHIGDHGDEGLDWLQRLLAAESAQRQGSGGQNEDGTVPARRVVARARALNAAGFFLCAYKEGCGATVTLEESLALLQGIKGQAPLEMAEACLNLGRCSSQISDYARSSGLLEQALALYRSAGHTFGMAECCNELGILETKEGHAEKAVAMLEQALALRRKLNDADGTGFTLTSLGEFAFLKGDFARARELLEESQAYFRQSRNRIFSMMTLDFLSLTAWMMGDADGALEYYRIAQARGWLVHETRMTAGQMVRRADMALGVGDYAGALAAYQEALAFSQKVESPSYTLLSLFGLGRAAWVRKDHAEAEARLREAYPIAQKNASRGMMAQVCTALSRVALSRNDDAQALSLAAHALPLFQMPFYHWAAGLALEITACLEARKGQFERAVRLFGAVEAIAERTRAFRSPAEQAQIADYLRMAQSALPEADFERLKREGQALSLEQATAYALGG